MRLAGILAAIIIVTVVNCLSLHRSRPSSRGAVQRPPVVAPAAVDQRPVHPDSALEARLEALARNAPGRCAIAAKNLETGAVASVNANMRVSLLSVVKLPVALAVLDGVDRGRWTLTTPIPLIALDMHPRGWIGDRYPRGGGHLELRRLLVEMLTRSDNSAADALMRVAGGPVAITAWLNQHGIRDLRVDRSERGLGNDWYGLASGADTKGSAEAIRALRARVPDAVHDSAARAMTLDPRDTGTAQACVNLLERLWHGDLLSAAMTDTLKSLLIRCKTGRDRLPGQLPRGTPVAHKTGTGGTWRGVTLAINDVGVIRLSNGDDVAIAVLLGETRGPTRRAERLIARTARAVYDAWSVADSAEAARTGPLAHR